MEQARKPAAIWITEILDPAGGFAYILDEQNKIAHKLALSSGGAARPSECESQRIEFVADTARPSVSQESPQPVTTSEKLGTQIMQNVVVDGTRTTTLYPGNRARKSLPLRFTVETWACR
jgi:hypothetical protein